MVYRGTVRAGVVVLEEGATLPDGVEVDVVLRPGDGHVGRGDEMPETSVWVRLGELVQRAEAQPTDLPEDLAANHDHYVHGLPKRT